ncbi:uncharacterized protein LOC132309147 [Cornus florida]|uniref:uncharacterized protein LOC132309147 n=1 Tax=Cornus florida TaxID=4283 RepID=UPI00289BA166|nr:uncharacterized protein LOC132309147 [Cornus florida]
MASRYNSFDSRSSTQSHQSDPSSSTELRPNHSSLKRLIGASNTRRGQSTSAISAPQNSSRALVKTKTSSDVAPIKAKNEQNLSAMVKKFMEKRSKPKTANRTALVIPADFIAEDLKKTARKGANFSGLHRKLFSKGSGSGSAGKDESERKALTEVKANTRSLAMVLRSERELLSQNKEQEAEINELKLILEEKNSEVEKLKNLCLSQREEINALKSAILFPDVMNSQLQQLLDKQGSELKQAKQLIPSLQRQVTSLTGQLQCLAEDLAEVKSEKYSVRGCYDPHASSPRTPAFDQEEAANSLDFSSGDHTTPGSPDDMFLKDLNPCLTPYYSTKSKEFEAMGYESPRDERMYNNNMQICHEIDFDSHARKLSKSSDHCQCSSSGSTAVRVARRSDERCTYGKQTHHKLF